MLVCFQVCNRWRWSLCPFTPNLRRAPLRATPQQRHRCRALLDLSAKIAHSVVDNFGSTCQHRFLVGQRVGGWRRRARLSRLAWGSRAIVRRLGCPHADR